MNQNRNQTRNPNKKPPNGGKFFLLWWLDNICFCIKIISVNINKEQVNKLSKLCVFCGQPPTDKNAEHVIPQWLMELTGKKSRPCYLGNILDGKSIAFQAFKFPACEECNSKYAKLEAVVKPIIVNILDGKSVSAENLNLLLDWFDKVRVGLWLGELYMSKRIDEFSPHMHIDSRMGAKDRMLIVERVAPDAPNRRGLGFIGPSTDQFLHNPCSFQLLINNYTFTSVSEYGLVARRLGFPYCDRMIRMSTEDVRANTIIRGTGRIQSPVVRSFTPTPEQTVIYQPIYRGLNQLSPDLYDAKYVIEHGLKPSDGIGGIFYQRGGRPAAYLAPGEQLNLTPRISNGDVYDMAVTHYQLHNYVTQNTYTTKFAPQEIQRNAQALTAFIVALNNRSIEICKQMANQK